MKTRYLKISMVLALCLTVMAVVIPSVGLGVDCSVEPMFQLPNYDVTAVRVANQIDFGDPSGPANNPGAQEWKSAPTTAVELGFKIVADVNNQATGNDILCDPLLYPPRILSVQAIHDGMTSLFRIVFADATQNVSIADVPLFHDALAIGIPYPTTLYGAACTPGPTQPEMLHMGTPCNGAEGLPCCPMHLMFWRADKVEIENIVANSPGTTVETVETDIPGLLNTYQNWANGTWTVIMGRVMTDPFLPASTIFPGRNMVDLVPGATNPIVFANWDGSGQERNGYKFISIFGNLIINAK